jgi:hypothetical protein
VAGAVADVVDDIQADVIPSLDSMTVGGGSGVPTSPIERMRIQLERPDDRPTFADEVASLVALRDPSITHRLVIVADAESADATERRRFHRADLIDPNSPMAEEIVRRMAEHGVATAAMAQTDAFAEVCRATIRVGEVLVAPGSPPSFVYVPTGPGLVVRPQGGYAPSPLPPWVPLGTTGVIRRAERNSEIVAEQEVAVVMIPGELYARTWLRPMRVDELVALMRPAEIQA